MSLKLAFAVDDTTIKNDAKKGTNMDFLKAILGDDLYSQVKAKLDAHNGDEANKEKQIKLANLAGGEYVGKGKFDSLQAILDGKESELTTANNLIADLKKSTKGNEDLQGKITQYETQVTELQSELAETKLKSAIKVALLSEKAVDVDYLTFKLNEKLKDKGVTLELDENDNIKGWDDQLAGLKVQFPTMFESAASSKNIIENKLNQKQDPDKGLTRNELLKKPYAERMQLFNENPEAYKAAMGE